MGFSSHMTSRSVTVYRFACVKHQSLTCATITWCDRKGSGKTHYCCCRPAALHPSSIRGYSTQVCFAITCNPVPRNATALGPTEACVHWVIWRRVCMCVFMCVYVFPAALHAPHYTLVWDDRLEQSFLVDGSFQFSSSLLLCTAEEYIA